MNTLLPFASDYMEGAHPEILRCLEKINLTPMTGYGTDPVCTDAKDEILAACGCPEGEVFFLSGGTQTNAVVIDSVLRGVEGVIATDTGHISLHEAGAIEFTGHKVIQLPHKLGKLNASDVKKYLKDFYADDNCTHMVQPGMVYISNPTEYGTLYTKSELTALSDICREYNIPLYLDGARLAYALASPENDITLRDLASMCDVFYIGGTKCGALIGEAVVIPKRGYIPFFFTSIKQHGALLAKGWLLGTQFHILFRDGLYERIGEPAIKNAQAIRSALKEIGLSLFFDTPTNQTFVIFPNEKLPALKEKVSYGFWEKYDETHTVIRFATSWATTEENTQKLIAVLKGLF